ncbi:MAG: SDR family oxidoreductase [Actinobacteria bacterium]|nr:SDR family oxidoreductase [Actinomycetota bacterium]
MIDQKRPKTRSALVSGAGAPGGIGIAIAKTLKELGAEVFITSTTERIHDRASEIGVTGLVADLTSESDCARVIEAVGTLDILVNNAGMASVNSPLGADEASDLTNVTSEAWQRGMQRNVDTAFNLTKAALPLLRKSKSGRIIMVSSVTGGLMAMADQPVYAAAKAAMIGLMRSIALDEAKYGVTCNAVLPGWIETDTQGAHEKLQGLKTPLGRSGKPEEIAGLVGWLASTSSGYMTGQALVVDGGNSIREERA